jgi:hypothetical protein
MSREHAPRLDLLSTWIDTAARDLEDIIELIGELHTELKSDHLVFGSKNCAMCETAEEVVKSHGLIARLAHNLRITR